MRFCPNCNHQVPEAVSACPRCGARLPVRAVSQPVSSDGESLPEDGFFVPDVAVLNAEPADEQTKPLPTYAQNTLRPEETKPVPDPTKIPVSPFVLPKDKVLLPKSEMDRVNAAMAAEGADAGKAADGQTGKEKKKPGNRIRRGIMLPLVALVLVVGLVGAVYLVYRNELYGLPDFPGKKDGAVPASASETDTRDWTVFLSDGDLYFLDVGLKRRLLLAEDIADAGVFSYENGEAVFPDGSNAVKALGENVLLGKDGRTLVYPVTVTPQGTSLLYVRDLSDPAKAPARLAENAKSCALSGDCTILTWLDGAGRLRQTEIRSGNTTLVSDDAPDGFAVSDDGRHVVFRSSGNELVSYIPGRPNKVEAKNVSAVFFVSDTLVYYLNHSRGLYRFDGKSTGLVSDGVTEVCKVYSDGGIYYLKNNGDKLILSDFIEDDLAGTDAAIAQPQKPTAPLFKDYPSLGAYNAAFDAYERAYKAYEEKQKAYEEKLARDELRLGLGQTKWVKELLTLCFYDGEVSTNVSERVDLSAPRVFSGHEPAVTFMQILPVSDKKLLFSEIVEPIDPDSVAGQIVTRHEKCCAAIGKTVYEIGGVSDVPDAVDYAGNTLYFRKTSGSALCRVTFDKDGQKGAVERLSGNTDFFASDPANGYWAAFSGGFDGVIAGQMVFAGRLTEDDVCPASVRFVNGGIAYLSDCAKNADGVYTGTLRFSDGETVTTLAKDVRMYDVSSKGTFLCLRSPASEGSTLYICGVGEVKDIPVSVLPSPDGAPLFARWSPLEDDRDQD